MSTEQSRALRELEETTEALADARGAVERLERTQTARIIRAVALGASRPAVAALVGLSRQRVQQITAGVVRGQTDRAAVKALARAGRPRQQDNAARAALIGGGN